MSPTKEYFLAEGLWDMCVINEKLIELNNKDRIELISTSAACAFLGISRTTLWRISQRDKTFPRPKKISLSKNSWNLQELNNWAQNQ